MRCFVALPTDHVDLGEEFLSRDGVVEVAQAAEAAGFEGVFTTEHPFPSDEWLASGGHHALDPFVALSFAAAATTRLRLLTYLCVLPYRNPFLAAKTALSLDVLSEGRLVFGVGAGYMAGEFEALGVDFDQRNELFDEALQAMDLAWTSDGVQLEGRHFTARGNTMRPRPRQSPRPPIWVGGNSARAIRRAARHGDGWMPMPNPRVMGDRRRSAHLESVDDLRRMLQRLDRERQECGRSGPFDVLAIPLVPAGASMSSVELDGFAEHVAELEALGVTALVVGFPAPSRREYVEALHAFADTTRPLGFG